MPALYAAAGADTLLDRIYRLRERLGQGGMGSIFRATHLLDGRTVAIKLVAPPDQGVLRPESRAERLFRLALAREFQTLASLHHPNVVRVLSYGFDDLLGPYVAMELLENCQHFFEAGQNLAVPQQVLLVVQLLRALAYVHQRGVLHRDIKSSNVLVVSGTEGTESALVKLVDFGIATEDAQTARLAGTVEYMAPEVLLGMNPTPASDLWAVGVLLHQLLTGRMPFHDHSPTRVIDGILGERSEETFSPTAAQFLEDYREARNSTPPSASEPDSAPTAILEKSAAVRGDERNLRLQAAAKVELPSLLPLDYPGPLGDVLRKLLARRLEERYQDAVSVLCDLSAAVGIKVAVETASTRESFLQATALVGRDEEMGLLKSAMKTAFLGQGTAWLIGGESGVGKSRIVAELRTLALVQGAWVAEGQAVTVGGAYFQEFLPLWRALCLRSELSDAEAAVFKDILPEVTSLLGRPIPEPPKIKPEDSLQRLADTLLAQLERLSRPLLLLLEDLQWGRPESLDLLIRLLPHLERLRVMVVASFRSDEAPKLPERLKGTKTLLLPRLTPAAIEQLAVSILGPAGRRRELIDYLERQTEGNVFFLVEIVRSLAESAGDLRRIGDGELPERVLTSGIERIIEKRLERIPAVFRPMMELCAVLGRRLERQVLEHAFPHLSIEDLIFSAANAAVLESQDTEWRFAHDKLRESLQRRMTSEEKQRWHKVAALSMEAVYTGLAQQTMSAALAHHFEQAGIAEKALEYYQMAGDGAARLYLNDAARGHYTAARTALAQRPGTPQSRRADVDLLLKLASVSLNNESADMQLSRLEIARSLLDSLAAPEIALREDRLRTARLDYFCGRVHNNTGQPGRAIPYFRKVLPIAEEFGEKELLVLPSLFVGLAFLLQGQMGKAKVLLAQTRESIERLFGIGMDTLRCSMFYALSLSASGCPADARREVERAERWKQQLGNALYSQLFHTLNALQALMAADWHLSITESLVAVELGQATNAMVMTSLATDVIGWAQNYLGHCEQALATRSKARELRLTISGGMASDWFEAGEAEILLSLGRDEEALHQAREVAQRSQQMGFLLSRVVAERVWGSVLGRLGGSAEEADAHFQTAMEICKDASQVIAGALTERLWGLACRHRGDEAAAQEHFARALGTFDASGCSGAAKDIRQLQQAAIGPGEVIYLGR